MVGALFGLAIPAVTVRFDRPVANVFRTKTELRGNDYRLYFLDTFAIDESRNRLVWLFAETWALYVSA